MTQFTIQQIEQEYEHRACKNQERTMFMIVRKDFPRVISYFQQDSETFFKVDGEEDYIELEDIIFDGDIIAWEETKELAWLAASRNK